MITYSPFQHLAREEICKTPWTRTEEEILYACDSAKSGPVNTQRWTTYQEEAVDRVAGVAEMIELGSKVLLMTRDVANDMYDLEHRVGPMSAMDGVTTGPPRKELMLLGKEFFG